MTSHIEMRPLSHSWNNNSFFLIGVFQCKLVEEAMSSAFIFFWVIWYTVTLWQLYSYLSAAINNYINRELGEGIKIRGSQDRMFSVPLNWRIPAENKRSKNKWNHEVWWTGQCPARLEHNFLNTIGLKALGDQWLFSSESRHVLNGHRLWMAKSRGEKGKKRVYGEEFLTFYLQQYLLEFSKMNFENTRAQWAVV